MIQELLHKAILNSQSKVADWFKQIRNEAPCPFYSSFDIRDSSFKIAPVDANLFPAGFNNICQVDRDAAPELADYYLKNHYPERSRYIALLAEEHTHNPYYWENVHSLVKLLKESGREVVVSLPKSFAEPISVQAASGAVMTIQPNRREADQLVINGRAVDLIISNNDFSLGAEDWIEGLNTPINPPYQLGWHSRRKDQFFAHYNRLAEEFARIIQIDPWHLRVETEKFEGFNVNEADSRTQLGQKIDEFLRRLGPEYEKRKIPHRPFSFVKNIAGTYGLGVTQVRTGDEVLAWSYKARKKMKAAKGGREIEAVIIQEGIPTILTQPGETAEPVVYLLGCQLAGGFLRTHSEKGPEESLNSPGAVFKRLCVSDLKVSQQGCPLENVYGWVARLAFLAVSLEIKEAGIPLAAYKY